MCAMVSVRVIESVWVCVVLQECCFRCCQVIVLWVWELVRVKQSHAQRHRFVKWVFVQALRQWKQFSLCRLLLSLFVYLLCLCPLSLALRPRSGPLPEGSFSRKTPMRHLQTYKIKKHRGITSHNNAKQREIEQIEEERNEVMTLQKHKQTKQLWTLKREHCGCHGDDAKKRTRQNRQRTDNMSLWSTAVRKRRAIQ